MNSKPKRPSLTALLREQPAAPSLSPEEQQRIQAENDQKLYGTRLPVASAPLPNLPATILPANVGSGGEEGIVDEMRCVQRREDDIGQGEMIEYEAGRRRSGLVGMSWSEWRRDNNEEDFGQLI